MALEFIDVGNANGLFAGTSLTVDPPATYAENDTLLLAIIAHNSSALDPTITASGWDPKASVGTDTKLSLYSKTAAAVELAYTITFSESVRCSAQVFAWRGGYLSSIITVVVTNTSSVVSVHSTSAITPDYANSVIFGLIGGADTGIQFGEFSGMTLLSQIPATSGAASRAMTASFLVHPSTSALSSRVTSSTGITSGNLINTSARMILAAINPSQAPTAPVITAPTAGQQIAIGRTIDVTWNPSTDPVVAQDDLTYEIEYSHNGGIEWHSLTTTAAGATSYSWNTTGRTASANYKLRIRADNGTEAGLYGTSSVFSLLADAVPGAPQNTYPSGTLNSEEDQEFGWTFNDPGDIQKGYELRYSTNADMSSSTTVSATTATSTHTFTANNGILATAGTYYWQVRTKGIVDDTFGAWSSAKTVVVIDPIAAPNITSPTNASPPTVGQFPVTFTGTGHVFIKYELYVSSVLRYASGTIASSANGFTIAVSIENGASVELKVARAAADGFWSAWDTETFTVSYTPPATPTLTVTAIDDQGTVQIVVTNSDTPAYQHLYVNDQRLDIPLLPPDAVFSYAGAESGIEYDYRVRAFTSSGGFADSDTEVGTQELEGLWLHEATKDLVTSTAVSSVLYIRALSCEPETKNEVEMMGFKNRAKMVAAFRRGSHKVLSYRVFFTVGEIANLRRLEAWVAAGSILCARDSFGHKVFGRALAISPVDLHIGMEFTLQVIEETYGEFVE